MILKNLLKKATIEASRKFVVVVKWSEWLYCGAENMV